MFWICCLAKKDFYLYRRWEDHFEKSTHMRTNEPREGERALTKLARLKEKNRISLSKIKIGDHMREMKRQTGPMSVREQSWWIWDWNSEREGEKKRASVCLCVRERERERVSVYSKHVHVYPYVCVGGCLCESVYVCFFYGCVFVGMYGRVCVSECETI